MSDTEKRVDDIIEETMEELYSASTKSEKPKRKKRKKKPKLTDDKTQIFDLSEQLEAQFEGVKDKKEAEDDFDEDEFLDEEPSDDDGNIRYIDTDEESEEKRVEKKGGLKKKIAKTAGIIVGALVVIYLALALFFNSHFMPTTTINGIDVSFKSVKKVEEFLATHVEEYVLVLEESDGGKEEISGADISAKYVSDDQLGKLLEEQENFLWLKSFWAKPELEMVIGVEYDDAALATLIENLACMQEDNQVKSENAHPEFQDTEFVVVPEVIGTEIDTESFNAAVREAVTTCQDTLNLTDAECYTYPKYVSDSEKVLEATEKMNSYLGAKITYDFSPNTEVVDASVISQWVKCSDKMKVTFDKKAVKEYIDELAEKYDTLGQNRKFTTARGDTVTVKGGYYGWKINQDAEYEQLIKDIKSGEEVTREPEYTMRGASHGDTDIGDTYAEVDLTNQHMYFTKNGKVVLDSPVVTGNPNKGNATPQGTYSLTYKTRNATLRGRRNADGEYEYETPVAYWMPFNGGIGFHDARWQSSFGGSRYLTNGSHGCVNMPKEKAAQLYELISQKTPVICYY
ncbi:MAG: L,D-transpeptidase family protein [Dorea sp.]